MMRCFRRGSIISCTVAEGKISSKTTAVGDPVLCTLNPVEKYGRSQFPYGSYLEGRFEAYQDPGHFVGKGWMELKFDRMYLGNRVMPMSAKVISVPGYKVASDGRILGNGHAVRDTIEWLIPVLWPIDLINLPRRGPRPVIKPETRLTLELMDDLGLPDNDIGYPPPAIRTPGRADRAGCSAAATAVSAASAAAAGCSAAGVLPELCAATAAGSSTAGGVSTGVPASGGGAVAAAGGVSVCSGGASSSAGLLPLRVSVLRAWLLG